jgi:hypothetical protein
MRASTTDPDRWAVTAREAWRDGFDRAAGTCEHYEHEDRAVLEAPRGSEAVVGRGDDFLVPQPT